MKNSKPHTTCGTQKSLDNLWACDRTSGNRANPVPRVFSSFANQSINPSFSLCTAAPYRKKNRKGAQAILHFTLQITGMSVT